MVITGVADRVPDRIDTSSMLMRFCPPVYQSSAQVLIIKKDTGVLGHGSRAWSRRTTTSDDSISMHTLLLRVPLSPPEAIEKHQLSGLTSFRGATNRIGLIVSGLGVDCKTFGSDEQRGDHFPRRQRRGLSQDPGCDRQDLPAVPGRDVPEYQRRNGPADLRCQG